MKTSNSLITKLISLATLLIVWEVLARFAVSPLLPPLSQCLCLLRDLETCREILFHLSWSLYRALSGLSLGTLVAVPLALFLGQNPRIDRILGPLVYVTYPFPKVVLVPILIVIMGIGDLSKISLTAIIVFYQMLVAVRDASSSVHPSYIESFRSMSSSRAGLYRHVIFPACLPQILSTIKLSLGTAIAVLFFTETYATSSGIGFDIWNAFARFDYPRVYLSSLVLCLLGLTLFELVALAERLWTGWNLQHQG